MYFFRSALIHDQVGSRIPTVDFNRMSVVIKPTFNAERRGKVYLWGGARAARNPCE